MLSKFSWLSLTGLLIGLGTWSDCVIAQALKSECEGLAVIAPRSDAHGTIYMKDNPDGTLHRAGYLPVGSVVVLKKPPSKKTGVDCAFYYEDEISGYLNGEDVAPLAKIIAKIKLEEVYGFIAPDTSNNSEPDSDLKLFRDEGLNSVLDSFSVTSQPRPVIFLMTKPPIASKALHVKYAQNVRHSRPTLRTAYIRAADDRAVNFNSGKFRIQRIRAFNGTSPPSDCKAGEEPTVPTGQTSSWWERGLNWFVRAVGGSAEEMEKQKENMLSHLKCDWSGNVSAALKIDPGKIIGIGPSLSAELKREKPAGKMWQFTQVGHRCDLKMQVFGIAHCSEKYPDYLLQAEFSVISGTAHPLGVIDREHAIPFIKGLRADIGSVNLPRRRELTQLRILPFSKGARTYFKDFEDFRSYIHDEVFQQLKFPREDRMTITLLLAETLIYWQDNRNND